MIRLIRPLAGIVSVLGMMVVTAAWSHESEHGPVVVPHGERDLAAKGAMSGPSKNKGVRSVTPVGAVALGGELPSVSGRQMRAREIVVEPGGVVAIHQHHERPGIAYILEGEIIEHRNDTPKPVIHRPGSVAVEKTGITHWWENRGPRAVRALVVDIVPVEKK